MHGCFCRKELECSLRHCQPWIFCTNDDALFTAAGFNNTPGHADSRMGMDARSRALGIRFAACIWRPANWQKPNRVDHANARKLEAAVQSCFY